MNLEKEFAPYTEALELKELGFDEFCFKCKVIGQEHLDYTPSDYDDFPEQKEKEVLIPTFSQAFRWFREKYLLFGYPFLNDYQNYGYRIVEMISDENKELVYDWGTKDTYEEAELACLIKLIEIVKNK